MHLYNNSPDLEVVNDLATSYIINLTSMVFDNPLDNYQNYTNLSINDTVASGDNYSIKWTTNQSAPPATSFAQTYVNITTISGTPSIDRIVWSWISGQLTGYNSSLFQLWNYNATGWTLLNNTPNTVGNTLSLSNLAPQNLYAILQSLGNCPIITASGTYTQGMNYTGAPNNASPLINSTCVKIAASNVTYNCNGFSITNNVTGTTYGILVNGSLNNITIENCPMVTNYSYGIYVYQSNNSNIINSTAFNDTLVGIDINSSSNDTITNSTGFSPSGYGFYLNATINSLFVNATGSSTSGYGIYIQSSSNFTLINSTGSSNSQAGIVLASSSNETIINSTGNSNSSYGIYLVSNSNGTITNSLGNSNTSYGFFLNQSSSNNFTGDNASKDAFGFYLVNSNLNNFSNNTASNNTNTGLLMDTASGSNVFASDTFCFNNVSDVNNIGSSNSGAGDKCDNWYNWSESGHAGCTYTCSQVWELFFGNISGNLLLANNNSQVVYSWIWNGQNGNVYAYNGGVTINWADIIALGRSSSGSNSTNDFTSLDALLNYTGRSDSITHLYSIDGSTPNVTKNMTIYGRPVPYVPVANSTSASMNVSATTGILWDNSTDTDGHYGATDNENVVFVTQINSTAANQYYIRVPSNLSTYKTTAGTVQFWVEMQ